MIALITGLLGSRKFWVGFLAVAAITATTVLRALDKIPADALTATIAGISTIGLGVIGSIAWENTAASHAIATQNLAMTSLLSYEQKHKPPVPVVKPGEKNMQFAIINKSTDKAMTPAILTQIAEACERQLYEDYAAFWEAVGAKVGFYSDEKNAPSDAVLVIIFDHSDQAGALGYHDVTPQGRPYARIFWEAIRDNGGSLFGGANSLSVTISHEVLETIGDPYANFWAQNPKTGKLHALELSDAVESDAYPIDGIYVSNFVGPRFFREGAGPYDWMSQMQGGVPLITAPFESRSDGYQITGDGPTNIQSVFGKTYPEWKKQQKEHPAARKSKRKHVAQGTTIPKAAEQTS